MLPMIKDSGNRTEFDTGAVRDMHEAKGRCDLMPLDVIADVYNSLCTDESVWVTLKCISDFVNTGHSINLVLALSNFSEWDNFSTMFLETAKHFEQGAKKYGEYNWQKGIPVKSYIDSAVRHYLKWLRGDTDEPHDRAFCWNIVCAMWTVENKPDYMDLPFNETGDKNE
jgi:hypothetical protein